MGLGLTTLQITTRWKEGTTKMSTFKDMEQLGEQLERVKGYQDQVLDQYVPDSKPHRDIMISLSSLEQEIKALLGEYQTYVRNGN